jgi:hypothetical protein
MELTSLMNVGPRIADDLHLLGIRSVEDLRHNEADDLYDRLCELTGRRQDPCVLDTFRSAVDQANGKPARPWWEYSRERKASG